MPIIDPIIADKIINVIKYFKLLIKYIIIKGLIFCHVTNK